MDKKNIKGGVLAPRFVLPLRSGRIAQLWVVDAHTLRLELVNKHSLW